eukprot:234644-Chlamydomonas_euryale.AAC.11
MQAGRRYLDVRTPQEFGEAHPPGSVNVPVRVAGAVGMAPNPKFVEQVGRGGGRAISTWDGTDEGGAGGTRVWCSGGRWRGLEAS